MLGSVPTDRPTTAKDDKHYVLISLTGPPLAVAHSYEDIRG